MPAEKGKSRRLGSIDLDTGEIFEEGVPVWVGSKIKWNEGFVMTFQEAIVRVAEDKDMTHQMTRVWLIMLGKISFENWVTVPQIEIAASLGMKKSDVSRAIRRLIDKGLILRGPKIGRTSAYKLNSHYAWKGKLKGLKEERVAQVKDFYAEAVKRGFSEVNQRTSE